MNKEDWCHNCDNHFDDCECWECEECGDVVEDGETLCENCKEEEEDDE